MSNTSNNTVEFYLSSLQNDNLSGLEASNQPNLLKIERNAVLDPNNQVIFPESVAHFFCSNDECKREITQKELDALHCDGCNQDVDYFQLGCIEFATPDLPK